LNVQGVNVVAQTEMQISEPKVTEPSSFVIEIDTEKLKRYTSPGIDKFR